jgi:hypothetical protein
MHLSTRWAMSLKAAATLLFLGHMFATCVQHIPKDSSLRPAAAPFVGYQALTGIWQDWDMFITIPYLHSYDVRLEVIDANGEDDRNGASGANGANGKRALRSYGPMLPGLRAYDGDIRSEAFFTRVLDEDAFAGYRDAYARGVCKALVASSGHGGQTLVFRERFDRIRPLADIRAGGGIGKRDDHNTKFACE